MELNLSSVPGLSNFQADHCVVGIHARSSWRIRPVFARVPAVFLGVPSSGLLVTADSGFTYEN